MNTHNTETKPAGKADPVLSTCHRLRLAMGQRVAAVAITGNLPPGPDFDAAEIIERRAWGEVNAALEVFAAAKPATPLAFATYLEAFAVGLAHEAAGGACIYREIDEPPDDDDKTPSVYDIVRVLVESFDNIFKAEGGLYHDKPPAAHRSKALDEPQVRQRMLDLFDVLGLPIHLHIWQINEALESDDALIAFARHHNESLDWIVMGDEAARRNRRAS